MFLHDVVYEPRRAEKEREPMARQLSVTVALVSSPCYHVKPFFFLLKGIKEWFAHYGRCDFSREIHMLCLPLQNVFCLPYWNEFISHYIYLSKLLIHILGHMQHLLSCVFWGSQASHKLKLSRRCYRNDSSTRNTTRVLLYSVSACFHFYVSQVLRLRSKLIFILIFAWVNQGYRHQVLFRHRLLWRSRWKDCKLS